MARHSHIPTSEPTRRSTMRLGCDTTRLAEVCAALLLAVTTATGQAMTASTATGGCVEAIVGWTDSYGDSCVGYASWGYCTQAGGYGTNWDLTWGVRPAMMLLPPSRLCIPRPQ